MTPRATPQAFYPDTRGYVSCCPGLRFRLRSLLPEATCPNMILCNYLIYKKLYKVYNIPYYNQLSNFVFPPFIVSLIAYIYIHWSKSTYEIKFVLSECSIMKHTRTINGNQMVIHMWRITKLNYTKETSLFTD